MSDYIFEIGGENEFILLPAADGVRCLLQKIEPDEFGRLRFSFLLDDPDYDDGDSEDVDAAIQQASEDEFVHVESVNVPQGRVGKRTKMYKIVKGLSGGDFEEGDRVDLSPYLNKHYLVDFEHVDKQTKVGDAFEIVRDERGRPIKKAAISKLKPEKRTKKASTKTRKVEAQVEPDVPEDDDDIDLDAEE